MTVFVTWTVTAAPEFSLEPKEWWYPVVGRLGYRGYFRKEEAVALARELMGEGWDVSVGGVTAYSTLGWLSDPLLNTYLFDPELALADVLFHELAHRRFFVAGDTEFNEAYATAVATEGVRRWIVKQLAALVDDPRSAGAAVDDVLRLCARRQEGTVDLKGARAEIRRVGERGVRLALSGANPHISPRPPR